MALQQEEVERGTRKERGEAKFHRGTSRSEARSPRLGPDSTVLQVDSPTFCFHRHTFTLIYGNPSRWASGHTAERVRVRARLRGRRLCVPEGHCHVQQY